MTNKSNVERKSKEHARKQELEKIQRQNCNKRDNTQRQLDILKRELELTSKQLLLTKNELARNLKKLEETLEETK